MKEFLPNPKLIEEFDTLAQEDQLLVLNIVCSVYARQLKYNQHNADVYMTGLMQEVDSNLHPYIGAVYLDMWNK